MKTPELVVPDIYRMLEQHKADPDVDMEAVIEQFGEECKDALRAAVSPQEERSGLRLSAVGKTSRKLWQTFYGIRGEDLDGQTYIKFLFGHLTEALVLAMAKLAGHSVTDQQREVEVEGVKGHIDCFLDGRLIDVKSASSFGFRKFKYNKLHEDDSFGYIPQLHCYAHALEQRKYGWLVLEKQSGELTYMEYDLDLPNQRYAEAVDWDAAERVRKVKLMLEGPLPSKCYEPIPEGKSGNMKLQSGCVYCAFRDTCWPNAVEYKYSNGPKYLTTVTKEPRVEKMGEAPDDF